MILLCCCSVSHIFPQLSSSTVEMKKRMCRCVQPALNSSKWKAGELLLIFCCSRENLRQHGCATVATPQGVRCREAGCRPGEDMVLGDWKTLQLVLANCCYVTWPKLIYFFRSLEVAMDQYLYIPFLGGWTSIYQLFWCSPGVQGFDTLPYVFAKMYPKNVRKKSQVNRPVEWFVPWSSEGLVS